MMPKLRWHRGAILCAAFLVCSAGTSRAEASHDNENPPRPKIWTLGIIPFWERGVSTRTSQIAMWGSAGEKSHAYSVVMFYFGEKWGAQSTKGESSPTENWTAVVNPPPDNGHIWPNGLAFAALYVDGKLTAGSWMYFY